jgi:hypothetical protein
MMLFQVHIGLSDSIQGLETVGFDAEDFFALMDTGCILVEFQVT